MPLTDRSLSAPMIRELVQEKFPQFERELQEELARSATLREFAPGTPLMRTGQYFTSTLLIIEGLVKLYREGEDGNEFFIYYLNPGQACALSMICAAKHEASQIMAQAVEPTLALALPLEQMDSLMRQYRTWYYFVLETYRMRFEELLMTLDSIAFQALDERLVFYLKRQQEALGTRQLPLTHQQIADDLNSSREVISRLLKKLEQQGRVQLHRQTIELRAL
jgi:CRP/FNR family transcriptional regulator